MCSKAISLSPAVYLHHTECIAQSAALQRDAGWRGMGYGDMPAEPTWGFLTIVFALNKGF